MTAQRPRRWENYFFRRGTEFGDFWSSYLQAGERSLLFLIGLGFDPRALHALKALLTLGGKGSRDCISVEFDEGQGSPSRKHYDMVQKNRAELSSLIPKDATSTKTISMLSRDGRRVGSRNASNLIGTASEIAKYSDIVIDVSAMPRGVYFPLIGKVLYLLDTFTKEGKQGSIPNLHVIVSENPHLDSKIVDEGIDEDASYMHGFTGTLDTEASTGSPKIWIPILGERQGPQLERVDNLVQPDEICPIIPMPSVNPRRGDDLLLEYREFLFDRLRVEPRNFIPVSENNPFEVYREIYSTVLHYNQALNLLGHCRIVLSSHSSKLLSIGTLLAAYELKSKGVGVAHVETHGYQIEGEIDVGSELGQTELSTLWLSGDCYA